MGWGACAEHRVTPYEVYVVSERIQFLLLEPGDLFWDCWELEGLGAGFAVWVRGISISYTHLTMPAILIV